MNTFQQLLDIKEEKGAGYLVLLDPDQTTRDNLVASARIYQEQGADGLLIGGSLVFADGFDALVQDVKAAVSVPLILFPGSGRQLSRFADAVLFMSLISGRNPHYLIGEQVLSAPMVHAINLETISTGYMLVASGTATSVEFISGTKPFPREKPQIAVAHALAAHYLGMKLLYLEAGSGAVMSVPEEMISAVSRSVPLPLIVGGGIKTPEDAGKKVAAGASFVVTGNVLETTRKTDLVRGIADAVHSASLQSGPSA